MASTTRGAAATPRLVRGWCAGGWGRSRSGVGAEEGVELVLDEGPEALAHEDFGQAGVAGLLEALEEELLDEVGARTLESK